MAKFAGFGRPTISGLDVSIGKPTIMGQGGQGGQRPPGHAAMVFTSLPEEVQNAIVDALIGGGAPVSKDDGDGQDSEGAGDIDMSQVGNNPNFSMGEGMDFSNEPPGDAYAFDEGEGSLKPPLEKPGFTMGGGLSPGQQWQSPTYPEEQSYDKGYQKRRGPGPWNK